MCYKWERKVLAPRHPLFEFRTCPDIISAHRSHSSRMRGDLAQASLWVLAGMRTYMHTLHVHQVWSAHAHMSTHQHCDLGEESIWHGHVESIINWGEASFEMITTVL